MIVEPTAFTLVPPGKCVCGVCVKVDCSTRRTVGVLLLQSPKGQCRHYDKSGTFGRIYLYFERPLSRTLKIL